MALARTPQASPRSGGLGGLRHGGARYCTPCANHRRRGRTRCSWCQPPPTRRLSNREAAQSTQIYWGTSPTSDCAALTRMGGLRRAGREAVPGAGEAYTCGSWHDAPDGSRPRRDVVDAVDADEAIDGCSEPCLWRLQLNITRRGFVGGCGTSRGGKATCCTPSTRAEAL